MRTVAALYVDPRGIYSWMRGVDCWGEKRDARRYAGPHPVVAHPPCQLWVNLAAVNFKRWGGERNRPGNDGGCFQRALGDVLRWGGVLEHPASSNAWKEFGLVRPDCIGWRSVISDYYGRSYWVCEVWQSAYGHRARKRTWLLYHGGIQRPLEANWSREPGTAQIGWFDRIKPTLGKKEASATPQAFAEYLVTLARSSLA